MSSFEKYLSIDGCRIRGVRDSDVDALVVLINKAYSYQDETKGEPRTNPTHLRKKIGETDFYVVEHEAQVIGCVYLEPKGPALKFGLLTLAPPYRGKGIAEDIMASIDEYAKENGFTSVELDYMSLAPWLKPYYEKYGFIETGEVTKWGSIDLIQMSKKVHR